MNSKCAFPVLVKFFLDIFFIYVFLLNLSHIVWYFGKNFTVDTPFLFYSH